MVIYSNYIYIYKTITNLRNWLKQGHSKLKIAETLRSFGDDSTHIPCKHHSSDVSPDVRSHGIHPDHVWFLLSSDNHTGKLGNDHVWMIVSESCECLRWKFWTTYPHRIEIFDGRRSGGRLPMDEAMNGAWPTIMGDWWTSSFIHAVFLLKHASLLLSSQR